jgi:carbamoyl-phosphate synthase large subunit
MARVLVTGVGGGVGQSIIKCLQGSEHDVIGTDADALATGAYALRKAYKVPYATEPDYVERLLAICQSEACQLVFPGIDAELPVLAASAAQFQAVGTTVVVSEPSVVALCDDKLHTAEFLRKQGLPAPKTVSLGDACKGALSLPFVLKPRIGGARSRGVYEVHDAHDLAIRVHAIGQEPYVAQELISGDEYTCSIVGLDDRLYGPILMRRILRDGDTYKAFVVEDAKIAALVTGVSECLRPFGALNIQLRRRDGIPYLFEINARCSGTTHGRALAGFNEPRMIADYLIHGRTPQYRIRAISILRYWNELVVDHAHIDAFAERGEVMGDGVGL